MGIFLRHSHNVKPERYGSEADVQYSIAKNSEKIYGVDPNSNVLVMPLFFGFPCLDFSGKQNHGTPYGGVAYHSGSLSFDGVDDYVEVVDSASLDLSSFVIGGWFKWTSGAGSSVDKILDKTLSGGGNGWSFRVSSANQIGFWEPLNAWTESNVLSWSNGVWYHIIVTYNGTNMIFYRDGSGVGSSAKTLGTINTSEPLKMGGAGLSQYPQPFNGLIDEVRISNVALTTEQIALFYARPWDLYRRVGRTYYSVAAAPSIYIPRIMIF